MPSSPGNVKVANALGSGLIESAAIMPFLPGLARQLLGEKLRLPSVATWWCGPDGRAGLGARESGVSRCQTGHFPCAAWNPSLAPELTKCKRAEFEERLRTFPHEYVAQERVALSTAPVWEDNRLNSRRMVLRTYVLNTSDGWLAIPGGLVRVAEADGSVVFDAAGWSQQGRLGSVG